jgi:predicted dehydrogenase
METKMGRRTFLQNGAFGLGSVMAARPGSWIGANNRVRVGVVGINGMGRNHIRAFAQLPEVEVAAICDVDENLFPAVIDEFARTGRPKPKTYSDLRKLFEDKDIDAVSIVTPNHWHALAALWAIQAGKHVAVEKPCCHNVYEGRQLVAAAKQARVIVQDGAEQRSNPCAQTMAKFLAEGGLGEVYLAKGLCYKWRKSIGRLADEPVPKGVHYDLWLGPAPQRPFNRNRFHYNWHWNWEYGNGDIGNQGVHELDVARWGLGVKLPTRVHASGGHFMFDDDQQTPNTLMAIYEFPNPKGAAEKKKILQFEVRGWITNAEDPFWLPKRAAAPKAAGIGDAGYMATGSGNAIGNLFFGSKGYMVKDVAEWRTYMGEAREPGPTGKGEANHYAAFVDAIRGGDPAKHNPNMEEAFYSCALIHLANISYRLGRSLDFDPETLTFPRDAEANRMLTREYRAPFVVHDFLGTSRTQAAKWPVDR